MAKLKTGPKVKRKGGGVAAKAEKVNELGEQIAGASAVLVTEYRGLTVKDLQELRRKLRARGLEYHVVKNKLFSRAAQAAGRSAIAPLLVGPTAIAVPAKDGKADEVEIAKTLVEEMRTYKALKLMGALIRDRAYGAEDVTALARLPGRAQLQGQLVGTLQAPLGQLTNTLRAPFATLIHVFTARGQAA